mgnify:CR=1 FL=1
MALENLQLRSLIKKSGELELSLVKLPVADPAPDEIVVRITAKLIQADGFQVWVSDKLDRELKNIFALHDEVAGLIAKNLSLKLGTGSAAATAAVLLPSPNPASGAAAKMTSPEPLATTLPPPSCTL